MRIPLIAGEWLPENLTAEDPTVAIVSRTTARRLWPDGDAVGKEFWMGIPYRVVGVVADVRSAALTEESPLTVYRQQSQQPLADLTFVVRARGEPLHLAGWIRDAIWRVDEALPVEIEPLSTVLSASTGKERFFTLLMAGFGAAALLLSALGLYGALAYTVRIRFREIALRRALGARPTALLAMILNRGVLLAAIGAGLGLAGALGTTRLLSGMLYEVSALDPLAYVAGLSLLFSTAVLAVILPALHAMRADPMIALKTE